MMRDVELVAAAAPPSSADKDVEEQPHYDNGEKFPATLDADGTVRVSGLVVDPDQNYKATEIKLFSFARPHMRAFHFQWLSFFVAFMAWFAYAPLLVIIRQDLDISTRGIWLSNVCNVAACVVARPLPVHRWLRTSR